MKSSPFFSVTSCLVLLSLGTAAQTVSSTSGIATATTTPALTAGASSAAASSGSPSGGGGSGTSSGSSSSSTSPPDVHLRVPELSVDRIELDVDNLQADINLAATVAQLVEINAGIQIGVTTVNITIVDVGAELELVVRLGNLVEIVNRTLTTLDLNPLLINVLNEATDLVDAVVGAVDGLLGSINNGDSTINFIVDNLGNIVQEVVGSSGTLLSSIVGNYLDNMTYTGAQTILDGGLIQKTYEYSPFNVLVNIVFNSLNQVVQAVVVGKGSGSSSSTSAAASTAAASSAAAAR